VSETHDALRASAKDAYKNGAISRTWLNDMLRRIDVTQKQEEGTA
jgi:hypothetical protein